MKDSENGKTVNLGRLKLCTRQVTQRWKGVCVRVCVCVCVCFGGGVLHIENLEDLQIGDYKPEVGQWP